MVHNHLLVQRKVKIPMRDGVNLTADIYRPKHLDTPLPILLMRLPYGRAIASTVVYKHPSWYAEQGYIVVIQEVRGTGSSEGEFYPFKYEYDDGLDTVEWCISEIPNNSGKLGMYGFSYQGVTQLQTAVMQPKGLVTICPCMASADLYNGFLYWGNALHWEFVLAWGLQLTLIRAKNKKLEPQATNLLKLQSEVRSWFHFLPISQLPILKDEPLADFFFDWLQYNQGNESYWQELNPLSYFRNYDVPALHIAGWADIFIEGSVHTYLQAKEHTSQPQYLIVPPYQHFPWNNKVGDIDFGETALKDIDGLQVDWFDYWLKDIDNGIAQKKTINLFLMGANQWLELETFPADHKVVFHLGQDKKLQTDPCPNSCLTDTVVYDPHVPTPATSYTFCDQSVINQRWDIVVYKSDPLLESISVIGQPKMQLLAETSTSQTDWVIKLLDIYPDGRQVLVTMGVLRTNSPPDRLQEYAILLRPTAYSFLVGHSLGVAIACSAFPLINRAPITATACQLEENIVQIYLSSQLILNTLD